MTDNAHLLKDVVQAARDGAQFYEAAARSVGSGALEQTFVRIAKSKRDLVAALCGRLEMIGEEAPQRESVGNSLRKAYADLRATLSRREDKVWIRQLEETEDRLLAQFQEAIDKTDNAEIRSQLQAHLPVVRASHDEMLTLKRRLAA